MTGDSMGSHTSDSNRASPGTVGAGQGAHRHQPGPNWRPEVVIGDVLPCDDLSRRLGIIYRMALLRARASKEAGDADASATPKVVAPGGAVQGVTADEQLARVHVGPTTADQLATGEVFDDQCNLK